VSTRYPDLVSRFGGRDAQVAGQVLLLSARLDSLAEALQDPLPMTVIHEEVHEANIFVRDGAARLLDWGEAAVSHPFAGVVNTFRDIAFRRRLRHNGRELKRLRAIYLEPWTRFAPARQLEELFDAGYLLGMLCRVLAWDAVTEGQAPEVRQEYVHNAEVWLDMFRESFEEGVRLGGP
jgi:aminoglycoside phosphotransferase (APT) family kinase protein